MSKQTEFIEKIAPIIQKYAPKYDIRVVSPIIGQACVESAWGESKLSAKYFNFFGIKCGSKWKGPSVNMKTQEEYTVGTKVTINDNFRVFDNLEEGIKGYFEFIQLDRYHNLRGITSPEKYLETIKADGYATSSTYVNIVMDVVNQYTLTKYDGRLTTSSSTSGGGTMSDVQKLLNVALAEEGYLEKRSNYQLDSKTANAGSNNYTKYWRDVYPAFQGQYWCDCYVKYCFIVAFGVSEAKRLLCHGDHEWSFYTPTSAQYFKNAGQWYSSPKAGDQIFFRNSSRICHTGIVTGVSGNTVYTIEGNTTSASGVVANGGCVRQKSYTIGSWNIAGYGRPAYSNAGSDTPVNPGSSSGSSTYNRSVQWTGIVTADSLNVRKGPGTGYDRLVSYPSIPEGTQVGVCDSTKASNGGIWYFIKISGSLGDKYGFVSSDYIRRAEESSGSSSSSSSGTADKFDSGVAGAYITTSNLNLRNRAGNGSVITVIPNGGKVRNYGYYTVSNGVKWLYVDYNGNVGFCSSKYLRKV